MKRDEELMLHYEMLTDDLGDLPYPILPPIASLFLRWLEEEEYVIADSDAEIDQIDVAFDEGATAGCVAKRFIDAICACDATLAELVEWVEDHGMPNVTSVYKRPEPELEDIQAEPNMDVKAIKESLADEEQLGWVYQGRSAMDWYRLYQLAMVKLAKLMNDKGFE